MPPYSVEFEKDSDEGLSADYLAIVAKALKTLVKTIKYQTRLELVDALKEKRVDLIPYDTQAANQDTELSLSIPYSLAQSVLISRRQAKFDRKLKSSRYRLMYAGDAELKALLQKRYPQAQITPAAPHLWAYTDTSLSEDTVFWSNSATQRFLSQLGLQNIILNGLSITQFAGKYARSRKTISGQKQTALRKLGLRSDLELFKFKEYFPSLDFSH